LLLAVVRGRLGLQFRLLIFTVVVFYLQIGIRLDQFHLQTAVIELRQHLSRLNPAALVF
jgi:hypothetical protein